VVALISHLGRGHDDRSGRAVVAHQLVICHGPVGLGTCLLGGDPGQVACDNISVNSSPKSLGGVRSLGDLPY
jgi:hypothetical protein